MRAGTLISGLLLVLLGLVFFLINLGYGSWTSLYEIGKCWPILLIILGLSLFGKGNIPRWLAYLVIFLAVGAVAGYMLWGEPAQQNNEAQQKSTVAISRQQYPQVKEGNLDINFSAGRFFIQPGSQDLLRVSSNTTKIRQQIEASQQNLQVDLSQSQYSWTPRKENRNRWQVDISPALTWKINLDADAIDGKIDLTGIPLRELNCDLDAGNMVLVLGNNGSNSRIKIDADAANVKLIIAKDTGVRIKADGELNNNNLEALGWEQVNGYYSSPNYQQAAAKINCDVNLSLGNLDVKMESIHKI